MPMALMLNPLRWLRALRWWWRVAVRGRGKGPPFWREGGYVRDGRWGPPPPPCL